MDLLSFLILLLVHAFVQCERLDSRVEYVEPGTYYKHTPPKSSFGFATSEMQIYCYAGSPKSLPQMFQTVVLQFDIDSDDYTQYQGYSPENVREHYEAQKSLFSFNLLSSKKTSVKLNPFNQTCIGIETAQPFRVHLSLIRIDFWKLILLTIGLFIFYSAAKLSENSLFYYLSGIFFGIFASFLILVYFASKLVPRRPMMYGVLLGGYTIAIYFIQLLWENIQVILVTYQAYVFWYVLITGFLSFVVCYRMGPPENQRSRDLIKWGLQLASLLLIYSSSDFQEAAAATTILAVVIYYFPRSVLLRMRAFYIRKFPPKSRLLTNEEYYEQGVRETTKALTDLRKYCNSPECKQWRTMLQLKDPVRFASFIEGSSHIMDDEILAYETSRADISESELSEDESNGEEQQEDNEGHNVQRQLAGYDLAPNYLPRNGDYHRTTEKYNSSYTRPSLNRNIVYRSYQREYSDED